MGQGDRWQLHPSAVGTVLDDRIVIRHGFGSAWVWSRVERCEAVQSDSLPEAAAVRRRLVMVVLVVAALAGCAMHPPKPPECNGPYTPING